MVQHLPVIAFLFHDFAALLVKDAPDSVKRAVKAPAEQRFFIKSEIEFLVLQGIQYVGHFFRILSFVHNADSAAPAIADADTKSMMSAVSMISCRGLSVVRYCISSALRTGSDG